MYYHGLPSAYRNEFSTNLQEAHTGRSEEAGRSTRADPEASVSTSSDRGQAIRDQQPPHDAELRCFFENRIPEYGSSRIPKSIAASTSLLLRGALLCSRRELQTKLSFHEVKSPSYFIQYE